MFQTVKNDPSSRPVYSLLPGLGVSGESRDSGRAAVVCQDSPPGERTTQGRGTVLLLAVPETLTVPETDPGSEGALQLEEDWSG